MACSTTDCSGEILARGLCKKCYRKQPDQVAKATERRRYRYHNDPEFHTKHLECKKRQHYAKTPEAKEKNRVYMREYIKQPEKRAQKNAYDRARWADPERREVIRNKKRALTCFFPGDLIMACRVLQNGQCAICSQRLEPGQGRAAEHADHCHDTSSPRGLLCSRCNLGLGVYERQQKPAGLVCEFYDSYIENPPVSRLSKG